MTKVEARRRAPLGCVAALLLACSGAGPIGAAEPAVLPPTLPAESAETTGAAGEPLVLTLDEAILRALESNPELAVERLAPQIVEADVLEHGAAFDPLLSFKLGRERVLARDLSSGGDLFDTTTDDLVGEAEVTQVLPSGTELELSASAEVIDASRDGQQLVESRVGFRLAQPLLQGAGATANLARVRQARQDVLASRYEARGLAELLVAEVEATYWDLAAARRRIEIYEESTTLAERLLEEIRLLIENGRLAPVQIVAAQAEIALRRQEQIDARAELEKTEVLLLGYLDLHRASERRPVRFADAPAAAPADDPQDVETHVATALCRRPELNQARALAASGELQVLRTRNGLLPRLDLFVELGKTGYADTFGGAWGDLDGDRYQLLFGVSFDHALGRSQARAEHQRAALGHSQSGEALRNLERLVQVDVRTALIEAARARSMLAALAVTRALDEEKLRVETDRFRLGHSSSFQVARAQRDLVERRIDEAEALGTYRKALVELYRLDGSLLKRRGIELPGTGPQGLPELDCP